MGQRGTKTRPWRAHAFLEAAPRAVATRNSGWEGELDELLGRVVCAAHDGWPTLVGPEVEEAFVRYLAVRVRPQDELRQVLGALHAADLGLAFGCVRGAPLACREVQRRITEDPVRTQRQLNATASFVDELFQVLCMKLLVADPPNEPGIANYSGRGALKSWLLAATFHAAMNLRRGRANEQTEDLEAVALAGELADPELVWIREQHRADFNEAFREALQALTSRARNVLRMYFVDGLTAEAIGKIYRVNRSTISRQLTAARQQVLEAVRADLSRRLSLDASQVDSLLRLLNSQLDVSIRSCLRSTPPSDEKHG